MKALINIFIKFLKHNVVVDISNYVHFKFKYKKTYLDDSVSLLYN